MDVTSQLAPYREEPLRPSDEAMERVPITYLSLEYVHGLARIMDVGTLGTTPPWISLGARLIGLDVAHTRHLEKFLPQAEVMYTERILQIYAVRDQGTLGGLVSALRDIKYGHLLEDYGEMARSIARYERDRAAEVSEFGCSGGDGDGREDATILLCYGYHGAALSQLFTPWGAPLPLWATSVTHSLQHTAGSSARPRVQQPQLPSSDSSYHPGSSDVDRVDLASTTSSSSSTSYHHHHQQQQRLPIVEEFLTLEEMRATPEEIAQCGGLVVVVCAVEEAAAAWWPRHHEDITRVQQVLHNSLRQCAACITLLGYDVALPAAPTAPTAAPSNAQPAAHSSHHSSAPPYTFTTRDLDKLRAVIVIIPSSLKQQVDEKIVDNIKQLQMLSGGGVARVMYVNCAGGPIPPTLGLHRRGLYIDPTTAVYSLDDLSTRLKTDVVRHVQSARIPVHPLLIVRARPWLTPRTFKQLYRYLTGKVTSANK